ncbi:glucoamylase family protein [Bythopirellula polymerisocia]|uniref:Glycoamylase-like domain-containing protein n=1 Tax=Bythopirellula polymerisocia TaxID=2528003 RepID=A0A5C6CZF8_9BACT|nr:glucoamylase family protein [Bythopirellula polymerisocia]TWU29315.1 hypothetical protein Pla144_00910 [Bythopirellula polymerisocia]
MHTKRCLTNPQWIVFFLGMMLSSKMAFAQEDVLRSKEATEALTHEFSTDDEILLDEIQRGCFQFLWEEVGDPVPLVMDRLTDDRVSSLAGVGFQLSAIPIGVERGWITRQEGLDYSLAILKGIVPRNDNKKFGIYLHYVDLNNGGMHQEQGPQVQASTVDHALLQAGAMTVASYFGGEVAELVDQMVSQANWKIYETKPEGFISFGWRPDDEGHDLETPGEFRPWNWHDASAEEQLVTFLAVGSPVAEHAVPPEVYYRLHRVLKSHKEMPPYAVSWAGPLFTYFFNHCWIDYRSFGADNPAQFGVDQSRIDWFENSRRAMLTHRQRCIEKADEFKTFGPDSWGLSPAADVNPDGTIGYIVQSVQPNLEERDNFCGGTVTPYAAGSAIMFVPDLAVEALRHFRNLKDTDGKHIVWRDIDEGGYGLLDSFNLDRTEQQGTPDYISIDEGPMLLAIENARTGLVWKLFMQHPSAQLAVERLKLKE